MAHHFLDSNILIYAYDVDAGEKHDVARELVRQLWGSRRGTLSTQVLQECYVTVTRKLAKPLPPAVARRVIATYEAWPVAPIDVAAIVSASEIAQLQQLSFWDALIITPASRPGASRLLTEDLQAGQRLEGVLIDNPFAG